MTPAELQHKSKRESSVGDFQLSGEGVGAASVSTLPAHRSSLFHSLCMQCIVKNMHMHMCRQINILLNIVVVVVAVVLLSFNHTKRDSLALPTNENETRRCRCRLRWQRSCEWRLRLRLTLLRLSFHSQYAPIAPRSVVSRQQRNFFSPNCLFFTFCCNSV